MTLEEVSTRTKIPRQLLADLEVNDLARWPKHRIYQLGLLRAYAAEVGLNADDVVAQFNADHQTQAPAAKHEARHPTDVRRRILFGVAAAAVCVLVFRLFSGLLGRERPSEVRGSFPDRGVPAATNIPLQPDATQATSGGDPPAQIEPPTGSEAEGELLIDSLPSGTWVVVNGVGRGKAPVRIRYLPLGSYSVRLMRDGYHSDEQRITLTPDQPIRTVRIILRQIGR